jgi:hypothetical protein
VIRFDLHGKTYCVWLTNEGVNLFISPLIYHRKTKIALFYETEGVHVLYTYMGLGPLPAWAVGGRTWSPMLRVGPGLPLSHTPSLTPTGQMASDGGAQG